MLLSLCCPLDHRQSGGYVHPSLRLSENAPCGARGILASARIDEADLLERSLVVVPKVRVRELQKGASPYPFVLHLGDAPPM